MVTIDPHPLLRVGVFVTHFPRPLADIDASRLAPGLKRDFAAPLPPPDDALRLAVRDLLRHGGFKPTGRSKPASEYLIKAADEGFLVPINAAVDACNVASLHSGFPISVVGLGAAAAPFRIGTAPEGASYVFNASGQTLDIGRLLCLFDAEGPCANAVKDSQRTKTSGETRETLSVVWGVDALAARVESAIRWYREMLESLGAETR